MVQLLCSCVEGLELALQRELSSLGHRSTLEAGGVALVAPRSVVPQLNVRLSCAGRVWIRLDGPRPLAAWGPKDVAPFAQPGVPVLIEGVRSELARALARGLGRDLRSSGEGLSLHVDGTSASLRVAVNTSGVHLHKRGYRTETGKAPLQETTAAALLWLASWTPREPLLDLMCGSGTFCIEAALQASGQGAGAQRTFAWETFPAFAGSAKPEGTAPSPAQLFGVDVNAGALGVARRNLARAGLSGRVVWQRADACTLPPPVESGLAVANLPWGLRVSRGDDALYARLGAHLQQRFGGWRYLLVGPRGFSAGPLLPDLRQPFSSGGVRVDALLGRIPAPGRDAKR